MGAKAEMQPVISPAISYTAVKSHEELSAGTSTGVCRRSRSFAAPFEFPFFLSFLEAIHPMNSTKFDGLKGVFQFHPLLCLMKLFITFMLQLTLTSSPCSSLSGAQHRAAACCCHVFVAASDGPEPKKSSVLL